MQIFNANLDILGRLRARRFPFQENIIDIQTDATLDPGASPATGARYIITDSGSLHANFGAISGVGNGDIVEYTGSAFEVMWDASAEGEGAQAYNEAANSFYIYDGSWSAPVTADEQVKISSNDSTTGYLEDKIVSNDSSLTISTLNDGADEDLNIVVDESNVDHDALSNFVSNEHIDHTAVDVTAGTGLSGGGDISASRTIDLDLNSLSTAAIAGGDELAFADVDDSNTPKKVTFSNLESALDHDNLANFVANEHVDHSAVNINTNADSGLSGGGDITASRTLSVDIDGTTAETSVEDGDKVLIYDSSGTALKSMTRADFIGSASLTMESAFDITLSGGGEVLGLPATPSVDGAAASKAYVDSLTSGLQDFRESVIDKDLLTPPGSPTTGDRYLIGTEGGGSSATGAWATHDGEIAEYNGSSWDFEAQPDSGTYVHVEDENAAYVFNNNTFASGDWVVFNSLNLTAGDGIDLSGQNISVDLKASGGLKIDTTELAVEPADFAGTGLEDDGSDNLRLAAQGNGIAGGAGSTLSVDPATEVAGSRAAVYVGADGVGIDLDNSTLEHSSSTLQIKDDGVTAAKLNSDTAGLGLTQAAGGELDVNVDDSTIEIATDTVQVKAGGIDKNELAAGVLDRYNALIGGSTAVAVNHALGLSTATACHITMFEVATGCVVHPDSFTFTDGNNITVNFATAPSASSIRINITSAEDIT